MGYQNYKDNQIGFHIHKFKAQVLLNIHIIYLTNFHCFLKLMQKYQHSKAYQTTKSNTHRLIIQSI